MKRLIAVFVLCAVMLCGCGNTETMISGRVTKVNDLDSDGRQIVITTQDGDEIGVQISRNTVVGSWIEDDSYAAMLLSGDIGDTQMTVDVYFDRRAKKIMKNNVQTVQTTYVMVDRVLQKGVKKLADGTELDAWLGNREKIYCLGDGSELLRINHPSGPDNVYVGNRESFDNFDEKAKQNVLDYYDSRGLLYDEDFYLEQAYIAYNRDKENFHTYLLDQSISPSASNENIMCFLTSVTVPLVESGQVGNELRFGDIFDRRTGEHIDGFDIFTCDGTEAAEIIIDAAFSDISFNAADVEDIAQLKADMLAAIKPEYIILWNENIEIAFPAGVLPTEEHCYLIGIDYTDEIKAVMHPWAIPDTEW